MRTVGEVAELAGVSVRTLHHYDELGLVVPSDRSEAGYRLYDHADLERLQEVLTLRALEVPLADIRALLDDPAHDRVQVLRAQAKRLRDRRDRLGDLLERIEDAIAAHDRGQPQLENAMFDGTDHEQHAREAEERWGDTEAWKQSQRRTRDYGDAEWEQVKAETEANEAAFAELLRGGVPADDERTAPLVAAHRQHIDRWFYDCSQQMQRNLAAMYVADERFAAHYDQREDGLARYVHDAIMSHTAA
jgi:DNA-binding transcriptional MerR regulator